MKESKQNLSDPAAQAEANPSMKQTTLCYLRRGEEYLLLHRVNRKKQAEGTDENAGKWIGFGGKFLPGETPEQCMLREFKEETGLTLTSYAYRGIIDFHSDRYAAEQMHLFTADGFSGTVTDCEEGEIAWIGIDRYLSLPMWEGDRIFLHLIASSAPFFHLILHYRGDTLKRAVLNGRILNKTEEGWR